MSLRYYFDHHVRSALADALGRLGIDVLTTRDDGRREEDDERLLERATELGRVLLTNDTDFLAIGTARQRTGTFFAGIVYAHQNRVSIGRCIEQLELMAQLLEPSDVANQVIHLRP
jgi:predicted nuclease of predicted toxin-antitoxin system